MTPKERAAMEQALEALVEADKYYDYDAIIAALREALAEQVHTPYCKQAPMCKTPCGNSDCVEQAEQEPFDMDDHPPHRLCECRKCMEYFTPLPDCDAFAASGKPIAEQEHDGHWSDCSVHNEPAYPNGPCDCGGYPPKPWRCACGANLYIDSNGAPASKAEPAEQEPVVKYPGCDYCNDELFCGRKCKCCGKVFIEDEDFVQSEVKSLRQQVAALKAVLDAWNNVEQEPVAWVDLEQWQSGEYDCFTSEKVAEYMTPLYAAPVRKKDLTDDEIMDLVRDECVDMRWPSTPLFIARAVIAADREKNK